MSNQGYWLNNGNQASSNDQQSGWYTNDNAPSTNGSQWQPEAGFYDGPSTTANNQSMDYSAPNAYSQHQYAAPTSQSPYYGGQVFYPDLTPSGPIGGGAVGSSSFDATDFSDEPPLLEELGINWDHIRQKTLAVLNPVKEASAEVIQDQDLAGPLVFCLLFGGALLLHGKVHFGYIYGIGVIGCVAMYGLLNLMAAEGISFTCTVSVLGYCLLPMALLSLSAALLSFQGIVGYLVSAMAVVWCSASSSKLFVTTLAMDHQRLLVAYPCTLLYAVFALLAIF